MNPQGKLADGLLSFCTVLTILVAPIFVSNVSAACVTPPSGLVSWWRGETNALDQAGTNHGTLAGNATYGTAQVGLGFVFDGNGAVVQLGNPASLHFQDLTIETWLRRTSPSVVSFNGGPGNGVIFGYDNGGYGLYLDPNGVPSFSKIGFNEVKPGVAITDTNWHHVAVTKVGSTVVFYVDGVAHPAAAYDPGFTFAGNAFLGGLGSFYTFYGTVDDLSVYSRALATNEIQAIYGAGGNGKCVAQSPPLIATQPVNQTVTVGETASFSVTATGTAPLSYQWRLNSTNIVGATADALVLTNVQLAAAGVYSVVVSNLGGTVTSSNAVLTVHSAPASPLVNVNFAAYDQVKTGFAAIGQTGSDFWNSFTFPFQTSVGFGGLKRADGTPTGVGLTVQNGGGHAGFAHPDLMYQSCCYAQDLGVISLTITNLPAGGYDIYLYGHGGGSTANTVFQLQVGGNNFGNQSTATDSNWSLTNWVEGAQYVVYRGVMVTNGGAPVLVKCHPGISGYTYLNGIQIQAAGQAPPVIASQPVNQTVTVGETASFSVTATGTAPLSYQWRLNSTNIVGATADTLVLTNVQPAAAGVYSVVVSNLGGTVTSSNATLTVNLIPNCVLPPAGLVSWWRAESNALDQTETNNGTLVGNATYAAGRVGQGFVFDGSGDGVTLGNPASLQLQDFTIETWFRRASASKASFDFNGGALFAYGGGGYGLGILDNGTPYLSRVEVDAVFPNVVITDTNLHHLAVTKLGTNVVFYVDGVPYLVPPYNTTYNFATPVAIGTRGDNLANSFLGTIDEVSVYNRQLSAGEVQAIYSAGSAGKCVAPPPPPCVAVPAGMVSWWRGENNPLDQTGTNNGALVGHATYGTGRVGQGFVLDGSGDSVTIGNPPSLQLQDFTIEAWIKRSSSSAASLDFGGGIILGYGGGGYALGILDNGTPFLTRVAVDAVFATTTIADTNLHHLAVTKLGSTVVFYLDGVAYLAPAYNTTYNFATSAAIGARGDNFANSFFGTIDELTIYSRSLSAGEIQAIYGAGSDGKCLAASPPVITAQPVTQTVTVGETATFSVTASGTAPLSYQWRLNSTNIAGATADTLVLTNAQPSVAGAYSVVVSNTVGTVTSSNAILTVNISQGCTAQPAGLVSWWRGEVNALDQIGTNNGNLVGNTSYGGGRVGQGFVFDGSGDGVTLGNPASLQLQDFTIETWIRRGSTTKASFDFNGGEIFGYGGGGYVLGMLDNGTPFLSRVEVDAVFASTAITDTNLHHLAVTKLGTNVVFYVDGVAYSAPPYDTTYNFATPVAIGARGDNLANSFLGTIDEVSVYNRQLSAGEIQAIYSAGSAGKCVAPPPPSCVAVPPGVVGWWRGENNPLDQAGTNNGSLVGNASYAAGRVGQAFVFDGSGDGVALGNPASLQLQDFTIEAWIKRASPTVASFDFNGGEIFGYGGGGYALGIMDNGTPYLTRVAVDNVMPSTAITDTNLHHLAVTKLGTSVVFYVDGVAFPVPPYNTTYNFATPAAIGARGDNLANSFYGRIDEVTVYNRQLSAGEIRGIFEAGSDGKCVPVTAPFFTSQPATQTVTIGETATFSVTASGTPPLSYQWRLNGTNIVGAVADTLVLTNVQPSAAGTYSVVVSNYLGSAISSNATLVVNALVGCIAPPSGLVSWWRGENNTLDQVGGNNGVLAGHATYGAGRVSQGFVFDGNGDAVLVGNPVSLQLQDFTIEAWIRRASASQASFNSGGGEIFGYGSGGYVLGILDNGTPFISRVEVDNVMPSTAITDTNLHHLVVTKLGTNVIFYVDGVAYLVPPYNTAYSFATAAAIGARGDNLANSFLGTIDEVSVYNRPLSVAEIQSLYNAGGSGKCLVPIPAFIVTQPANKSVLIGGNTTFSVAAGGTQPFNYQWFFNGTTITNATNATLNLVNVQTSQAGNYSVAVGNGVSPVPVLSSNATLTVTYPAANVRVVGTNIVSGRPVTLPIVVTANGNENALSFSLNYTTARLAFRSAQLGAYPPGTYFFVNTSQTNLGRLGVTVALPSGATFPPGTQLLAGVTFDAAIWLSANPTATTVSFGDNPMVRGLTDVNALTLAATYTSGSVTISGTDLEGDSYPRPGGSRSFTLNDWVQAGRFAAKLDIPATGGEFQRADAAPRGTAGDGQIKVTDWVQAGLYFAGSHPLTAVGGPTNEVAPTGPVGPDALRVIRLGVSNAVQDVAVTVPVILEAQGNENGVGFTVSYDPAAFSYLSATLGSGAAGANFNLNTNQIASGRLGLALVLPTGSSFAGGSRELLKVSLLPTVLGIYPVSLNDQLVLRGVSDPAAIELPASFVTGNLTVNPHPTLLITHAGTNVVVSWPALASGFNLQSTTNTAASGGWGDVPDAPQPEGDRLKVTLPITDQTKYFRLRYP